jgi:hypothetical protein
MALRELENDAQNLRIADDDSAWIPHLDPATWISEDDHGLDEPERRTGNLGVARGEEGLDGHRTGVDLAADALPSIPVHVPLITMTTHVAGQPLSLDHYDSTRSYQYVVDISTVCAKDYVVDEAVFIGKSTEQACYQSFAEPALSDTEKSATETAGQ